MKDIFFDLPEWHDQPRLVREIPGLGRPARSNAEYPDWHAAVIKHIYRVNREIREKWTGQDKAIEREVQRIRADKRYWINVYAGIYETRVDEDADDDRARGFLAPFILYPFQDYYLGWIDDRYKSKGRLGDGIAVKSRDMGVTNCLCADFAWRWMTKPIFSGRLLSRKEDAVDDKFNPDSMLWKVEYFLKSTPRFLFDRLVPGFSWRWNRNDLKIANPNNANLIGGESTNRSAGRGSRCTGMGLDEMAFMRNLKAIWTATRPATRHRLGASSVGLDEGMFFHDLVEPSKDFPDHKKPAIIRIYNSLHPFHDAAWLARERERDSDEGIRQEIFMDWYADGGNFVWPMLGPKRVGDFPYIPHAGVLFCAYDDGKDNDWATLWLQYFPDTGRHRVVRAHKGRGQIADFYGSLYTGIFDSRFHYTEDDIDLMAWTRQIETPIYIGDTHGRNDEVTSGLSVHTLLAQNWNIYTNVDYLKRQFSERLNAVGDQIDMLDWNDHPSVREALSDCKRYRWKGQRDGAELTTEYREPAHTRESHSATALQYYMTQFHDFAGLFSGGSGFVYYQDDDLRISDNPALDATYGQRPVLTYADIR